MLRCSTQEHLHIMYKSVEIQSAVMIPGMYMFVEFDNRIIVQNHIYVYMILFLGYSNNVARFN